LGRLLFLAGLLADALGYTCCPLFRPCHELFRPVEVLTQEYQTRNEEDPTRHNREDQAQDADEDEQEAADDFENVSHGILMTIVTGCSGIIPVTSSPEIYLPFIQTLIDADAFN
jgi:hypothetical protein